MTKGMISLDTFVEEVYDDRAFVEADDVAVNKEHWEAAKVGNADARELIKKSIQGLPIYMHLLDLQPGQVIVKVNDLVEAGIITCLKIGCFEDENFEAAK